LIYLGVYTDSAGIAQATTLICMACGAAPVGCALACPYQCKDAMVCIRCGAAVLTARGFLGFTHFLEVPE